VAYKVSHKNSPGDEIANVNFYAVRKLPEFAPLRRSRSSKVTDFGTNRKIIYDFLLVINTNLTCTVSEIYTVDRSKIAIRGYTPRV